MPAPEQHHAETARAVAEFYDRVLVPSRRAHPEYARLLACAPGERVGDFGCGQSLFYDALREQSPPPTFLDYSLNALRSIDYGLRLRADLHQLPLRSGVYDRIACIGVLHHLPERERVLREMARVLRPGGQLVLGVYAARSLQSALRRLHELARWRLWRRTLLGATELLLRARYWLAGHPIPARDARLRAQDFLEVPYVRYVPPETYVEQARAAGFALVEKRRIAGMNILVLQRA